MSAPADLATRRARRKSAPVEIAVADLEADRARRAQAAPATAAPPRRPDLAEQARPSRRVTSAGRSTARRRRGRGTRDQHEQDPEDEQQVQSQGAAAEPGEAPAEQVAIGLRGSRRIASRHSLEYRWRRRWRTSSAPVLTRKVRAKSSRSGEEERPVERAELRFGDLDRDVGREGAEAVERDSSRGSACCRSPSARSWSRPRPGRSRPSPPRRSPGSRSAAPPRVTVCQRLAPRASEPATRLRGTLEKASSEIAKMIGITAKPMAIPTTTALRWS
jgi:hypothetical protein